MAVQSSTMDMMVMRRSALDAMADLPEPPTADEPFATIQVDAGQYLTGGEPDGVPPALVTAVADRLIRDGVGAGEGAALVTGLSRVFDLPDTRRFHEALFQAVWHEFEPRAGAEVPGTGYRFKTNVTVDGAIPLELYGSRWSFKQLHMDRDALLFSHCYGPAAGFTGGALLLADVRAYASRTGLRFIDLFEWSQEPTPGSKPVLRAEYEERVLAACGTEVGVLGPDQILFVNNLPSAGVLHGVTPVVVRDQASYVREYHRCSVRRRGSAEQVPNDEPAR